MFPTLTIALYVTFAHGILFFLMNFMWEKTTPPPHKERLVVKTVQLEPKQLVAFHSPPQPQPQPRPPQQMIEETPEPIESLVVEEHLVVDAPPVIEQEMQAPTPPPPPPPPTPDPIKNETAINEKKPPIKKEIKVPSPSKKPTPIPIVDKKKVVKKEIKKPKEPAKKHNVKPVPTKKKKEEPTIQKPKAKPAAVIAKKAEPKGPTEQEKKQEAERKAQSAKQMQLLAKAKESMAKVNTSDAKIQYGASLEAMPNFSSIKSIESLQIDALPNLQDGSSLSDPETNYIAELRHRLELMLKLPDRGDVKILLTLSRSGNVDKLTIVNFKSDANKAYVETKLPKISFTNFGTNFANYDKYTFQITLKNQ